MDIAKYFISVGFKIDNKEVRSLDKALKDVEDGLKKSAAAGTKSTIVDKKVTKAKKEVVKVVDEQAEATKRAAKAEAEWIKKAREGQKVSNATFRAREAQRKFEQRAIQKQHMEAIKLDKAFNKATKSQKSPLVINRYQQSDMSADRIARIKHQEAESRRLAKTAANVEKARLAGISSGGSSLGNMEAANTRAELARRKQLIAENKANLAERDRLADQYHRAEKARLKEMAALRRIEDRDERRRYSQMESNRRADRSAAEWDRRQGLRQGSARHSIGAGGAAGIASRLYAPAIAIAGGAYGLSWLNRKNQEIVSAELGANAILGETGPQDMSWLKDQANKVGFNWLEAAPEFTGFMGAASPLMGHQKSLDTFQAFNEFATTRHAPAIARKRALMALKQMASKGTVMSEELFLQLGEAQGFTELPMMFAEALQQKTGGGLKGADAAKFLKEQMKLGKVKTGDILPLVTQMMSAKAAPTLAMSSKSSMAEQSRYQNAVNNQVTVANKAGVETGYARLFKAFTVAMEESTPVVIGLAKAFDEISKYVSFAFMLPQSIARAFDGRDSWVADAMGAANVKIAKDLFAGLSSLGGEIKTTLGLAFDGWGLIFEEFGAPLMGFLQTIKDVFLYTFKMLNFAISGDKKGVENSAAAMRASMSGMSAKDVEAIANGTYVAPIKTQDQGLAEYKAAVVRRDAILNTPANGVIETATQAGLLTGANWDVAHLQKYADSDSQNKARERNDFELSRAIALADDSKRFQQQAADSAKLNTTGVMPLPAISKQTLEVIIKAEDIEGAPNDTFAFKIANVVREQLGAVFNQTQSNFTVKESQ